MQLVEAVAARNAAEQRVAGMRRLVEEVDEGCSDRDDDPLQHA
jgi:hypothetical protein